MFTTTLGRITVFAVMVAAFCIGILLVAVWSVEDALQYKPQLHVGLFNVAKPSAEAFVVFDLQSGTEIASKNSTQVLPIASVTKLLTASMFYTNVDDLDASTVIVWQDVSTESEAGRLKLGEVYTYRELMYPLLLESSNDAAAAMLRVYPPLLQKMQEYVSSLGLEHTKFKDTSGLSDGNVSTAYELSLLMRDLYGKEPHIFDITRLPQFIGTHTGWLNNDPFVHEEGFAGGKHGYTYAANRTAVVFFNEPLQSGHIRTIGYVILGSDDLKADLELLQSEVRKSVRYE